MPASGEGACCLLNLPIPALLRPLPERRKEPVCCFDVFMTSGEEMGLRVSVQGKGGEEEGQGTTHNGACVNMS